MLQTRSSFAGPDRQPSADPSPAGSTPRLANVVGGIIYLLLGLLLVEVLFESWIQMLLAPKHVDDRNRIIADLPDWPKNLKNGLYVTLALLALTKVAVERRWRDFRTRADIAIAVLALVFVAAGLFGGSGLVLIAEACYVYLRGAIVFYAIRALDPTWAQMKRLFVILGVIVGANALIAIYQTFNPVTTSYTGLGWVDTTWAKLNRAHALLNHPNHLGHVLALTLLGVLSWFVTRRVSRWWWLAFGLGALAMSATQSRESVIGFAAGAVGIWLWRGRGRAVPVAVLLVVGLSGLQLAFDPDKRSELTRRLLGVVNAIDTPSGGEGGEYCVAGNPGCVEGGDRNVVAQREIRLLYLQQGGPLLMKRPALGYGVGQFGGIVAYDHDPLWYKDTRFGPDGFNMHGFIDTQVDSFWLHLTIEAGLLGLGAYLCWLWLLGSPMLRAIRSARHRRPGRSAKLPPGAATPAVDPPTASPFAYWAASSLLFGVLIGFLAPSLEDPLFPALLFAIVGYAWVQHRRGELLVAAPTPAEAGPAVAAPLASAPPASGPSASAPGPAADG